jgi:hypothetical protein
VTALTNGNIFVQIGVIGAHPRVREMLPLSNSFLLITTKSSLAIAYRLKQCVKTQMWAFGNLNLIAHYLGVNIPKNHSENGHFSQNENVE